MQAWKGKTRGGEWGYLFFIYMIKYLGITSAYTFLCFIVLYFIPFAPKATASTWVYARTILKYSRIKSILFLFTNYYRLGQVLIDKVAVSNGMVDKYNFKFDSYQEFLDVLNGDQGVVMIGAHVGNWEIGAPFFNKYGKKINILMYDAEHQKIKELLKKNSTPANYKIIPVNEDDLTHVFTMMDVLNKKEYVCFQGDRYVNKDKLLTCSFMGKEAFFPAGPFLLASRMKVPIVFYFAMREQGRTYHFHFTLINKISRCKDKKPEQQLLEQYASTLEKLLEQYPDQWFNYYKFWNKPQID